MLRAHKHLQGIVLYKSYYYHGLAFVAGALLGKGFLNGAGRKCARTLGFSGRGNLHLKVGEPLDKGSICAGTCNSPQLHITQWCDP